MKILKDLMAIIVGDAPPDNHTQGKRVRQGDVIFKEGDPVSDKAVKAAMDKGEPGVVDVTGSYVLMGEMKTGEVYIGGSPPRDAWVVSGPKATVVALSKESVEPLIAALCAANGDDPDDYTSTKSTVWIDMTQSVVRFPELDK